MTKHNFLPEALVELRPGAVFTVRDGEIFWEGDITEPSETEIQNKIAELEAAEPLQLLRKERDRRLASTDWRATIDYPGDDQSSWLDYRQALRDVTEQDPENVTWPEEP